MILSAWLVWNKVARFASITITRSPSDVNKVSSCVRRAAWVEGQSQVIYIYIYSFGRWVCPKPRTSDGLYKLIKSKVNKTGWTVHSISLQPFSGCNIKTFLSIVTHIKSFYYDFWKTITLFNYLTSNEKLRQSGTIFYNKAALVIVLWTTTNISNQCFKSVKAEKLESSEADHLDKIQCCEMEKKRQNCIVIVIFPQYEYI